MLFMVEDGMHRGMSASLLALTFLIPLSSAVSNTFIKWKLRHVPAAPLTAALLLVAGTALVPLQFLPWALDALHVAGPTAATVTPTSVAYLLLLGVIGSGISTMVFVWMVLKKGPLFAGMTTYVVPVLALLWGTFDHETINQGQIIAIAGVLSMVALVQFSAPRRFTVLEPVGPVDAITSLAILPESERLAMEPESRVA
jgi:drug/metabolite transporter (DMT)-like permease